MYVSRTLDGDERHDGGRTLASNEKDETGWLMRTLQFLLVGLFAVPVSSQEKTGQENSGQERKLQRSELPQRRVSLTILDAETKEPLPARVYLFDGSGKHYFFESTSDVGSAARYEKQNWNNKNSIEHHTTVSAHPSFALVPPGEYTLVVRRGKEYQTWRQSFIVDDADVALTAPIHRWINMADRGWYSGDTHLHRTLDEIDNVVMAEDLNVAFPLTNWVTIAETPPAAGNKNVVGEIPDELHVIDDHHVVWPRNTEYEIFSVGGKRHTLGALFVLGHKGPLKLTVPPWRPVVDASRRADPDVLFDMDKNAWPFAMLLPTIAPDATYELANNHMWRTEFGFRRWYTPAPNFIQTPFGGSEGNERQWIEFTWGMYYSLLNCGLKMPPTAGTANGVHPVPAGFGRVYVHLPDGFNYQSWREGLQQGRSFVTTGPMVFAKAAENDPGTRFLIDSKKEAAIPIKIETMSERPLGFGELIVNGRPEKLLRVQNNRTKSGAYRSEVETYHVPNRSGWFAIRFWEQEPAKEVSAKVRPRFAHTAPWYVQVDDQPVKIRPEEKEYLVNRMRDEMLRSRGVVSEAAMAEYQDALEFYRSIPELEDEEAVERQSRPLTGILGRKQWLENMVMHHRFTAHELRAATGMPIEEARDLVNKMTLRGFAKEDPPKLRLMPYPGGRHPRRGFLDGAIDPQRDTKISIFPPWREGGYVVVDTPEAIFSNLGLTYLAHEHIPTIWTEQGIELEKLEWKRNGDRYSFERELPNGITFGSEVEPNGNGNDGVAMRMWLRNGTDEKLTGLRSQVCVMMKGLVGFQSQSPRAQFTRNSFIAVKADESPRWLITSWKPLNRAWANPPVPCIHADPIFPDCPPGETVEVTGGLWFYEGEDVETEIKRLERGSL